MESQKREIIVAAGQDRKAYVEPRLVEWGALAELTGGDAGDPGDDLTTGSVTLF